MIVRRPVTSCHGNGLQSPPIEKRQRIVTDASRAFAILAGQGTLFAIAPRADADRLPEETVRLAMFPVDELMSRRKL
jgi:hypothetical protein